MRKLFLFLFAFTSLYLSSQTACSNAQPFCAGGSSGVTFPATTVAVTSNAPAGPDYGCLLTTPNAAWYYLQIANPGNLSILIEGQISGGPGGDVDYICWGPFTNLNNVCTNLTAANTVTCSYSGSYTETLNIPNGVTGQYYLVLITNFANVTQNIVFDQQTGTGNTDCNILQASNPVICAGSVANISASNNSNLTSPTYSINPGGLTSTNGQFAVSPVVTTNYTIYVTGINASNAVITQTAPVTVSVNPQPVVAPTTTQSSCTSTVNGFNLHLTFNPGSPAPTYTVAWSSIPNGITSANQFSLSGSIGAGSYVATVTANGGCTATPTITILPPPAQANYTLTPLGSTFSVTCANPQLIVTATQPAYSYTWNNGSSAPVTGGDIQFTTSNLGSWTITGVNPVSGCVASHVFTVGQNFTAPTSVITPSFQNITCLTGAQTVSVTSSPSINVANNFWAPNNGGTVTVNSYTAIYVPGGPGTFSCQTINLLNGCTTIKEFTVATSDNFPTLNVSSINNFTVGCLSHSTAAVSLAGETTPNAGGSLSYTVLPPGYTLTTHGTGPLQATYIYSTPGTYTAITREQGGCETKVAFSIIQDIQGPDIAADVPVSILSCFTPSTVLTAITSNTHVAFTWIFPGTSGTIAVVNPTIAVNTTTNTNSPVVATYTLSLQNLDNSCFSSLPVTIKQNLYAPHAAISGGLSFSVTCNLQSVNLSNTSVTGIPPATGYPTNNIIIANLWEGPTPQAPAQLQANYAATTPGIYTLTAKDLNNGCIAQATTNVVDNRIYPVVNNASQTTPTITLDCGVLNKKIGVTITGSKAGLAYAWLPPPNTGSVSGLNNDSLVIYQPGSYRVLVTNTITGCSTSGMVNVVVGALDASIAPDYTSGYAPLNVTFVNNSHSAGGSTSSITTVWSFGNGTTTTTTLAATPATAVYSQPGTYTVIAYANKGACQDTAVRFIHVDIPSKLEIPNVFTPNGDNVNDLFFLKVSNLDEINATIFDRWGRKVYELNSTTGNIAWDGTTMTGKDAAAGVYFYVIKATGKDGQSYDTKGTVTLYR